ncbi:hypothetical protein GCM10022225_80490 [Plantactinospora mayteni]|uniref:ATPase AAA-type core domain-containing protein n=1 Tax=Plantactinospora mayteni TaxID=566021 RepID=A0ABQ4F3H7_9ACTN|nr:ATP-binding protein [Plantactinospora mayteni]GIH01469.1 hypothetical protein Pma05_80410 [Plantactinospora mayteni]
MQIRRVTARNFRGIRQTEWRLPCQRFLCLVGAGDSTKTTLLDAIALVLTSRPNVTFSDADFYNCDVSQPIVLRVLIGDLTTALLDAEAGFGMWLTGLTPSGELEHDPAPASEECVMLQLTVDADLEPSWTVVRHGAYDDGMPLTSGRRRALGLFRVDERVDTHLRWGRGSALARLTDGGADAAVTAVRRTSRETVFNNVGADLQATASQVATAAGTIGGGKFTDLRPGWDPVASASPSALLLHEGTVPLTHAGLGSRRLISIAAQELATQDGNILLVDEIEHGLEPHRLLHVLHELRKRSDQRCGQVIVTTHSPIAVQAMVATDISVVRNDRDSGVTEVTPVPEEINEAQGALRAGPSAILARKVVVGEGATEAGILRALIRRWDDERIMGNVPTHAALGVAFLNGGGANAAIRAKVYHELGVTAALLVDNDDRGVDKNIDAAEGAGVSIARWQHGNSTEAEIISVLAEVAELREIVELAANHKSSEAVCSHLCTELPKLSAQEDPCSPDAWTAAGCTLDEVRAAIIAAAGGGSKRKNSDKAWFKREDAGETLGEFIYRHWNHYRSTHLGAELIKVRQFIYGDKEPTDTPKP